ncbi:Cerevisin [Dactylella cylindrospora]|nr:Cerevisin [Dactylella cylindrospora]
MHAQTSLLTILSTLLFSSQYVKVAAQDTATQDGNAENPQEPLPIWFFPIRSKSRYDSETFQKFINELDKPEIDDTGNYTYISMSEYLGALYMTFEGPEDVAAVFQEKYAKIIDSEELIPYNETRFYGFQYGRITSFNDWVFPEEETDPETSGGNSTVADGTDEPAPESTSSSTGVGGEEEPPEDLEGQEGLRRRSSLSKRALASVEKAHWSVAILSQAPNETLTNRYWYDDSAGEGVTIYVMDSGAELSHPEFAKSKGNIDSWLYAGPHPSESESDSDVEYFHGTGVLGKIIGSQTGIAKKASIVYVKYTDSNGIFSELNMIDGLMQLYDDIIDNRKKDKVIVYLGWGMPDFSAEDRFSEIVIGIMKEILQKLAKEKNVIIVTRAGDYGEEYLINEYPAVLAKRHENIITVGGVDRQYMNAYQTANFVKVWAPAQNVKVAIGPGGNGKDDYYMLNGTDYAAATVAGVLAGYISYQGDSIKAALNKLHSWAYPRKDGGPPIVWNGWREPMKNSTATASEPTSTSKSASNSATKTAKPTPKLENRSRLWLM